MTETKKKTTKKGDFGISVDEMTKAGVYFGHRVSRCHPKMKPHILGVKGSDHINIIDLDKTKDLLIKALEFIQEFIKEDKVLLFVGAKLPSKKLIKETAIECGLPYVVQRWIGGTITNFKIIKERIDYFKDLEKKKESGELEKYTKKERLEFDRELERLEEKFGGIKQMTKNPDALFVVDMKKDYLAIREARRKGITVVAISDTNVDPTLIDYPIPANDDAISSVKYILEQVKKVIIENKVKK
ncbi:MAG: 30S ribosomal protein S2 [Patescibacteria group bacterium]|nr:30S ribosomal protein S2 [Patescibacteria group bacterium]